MKNSINKKANKDVNVEIDKQVIHKLNIASVSATLTSLICAAITPTYASDIEIYKVPEDSVGSTTLMMMLDTSGSMDSKDGLSTSRMQRLKQGLSDVLQGTASVPRVDDKVVMGLATFSGDNGYIRIPAKPLGEKTGYQVQDGVYVKPRWQSYNRKISGKPKQYYNECKTWDPNNYNCLTWGGETTSKPSAYSTSSPYKTNTNTSCTYGDYSDCVFIWEELPKYRDLTHRDTLLTEINSNNLYADGGTPTPYAYAEAAAYLMGQSAPRNDLQAYFVLSGQYSGYYAVCTSWAGITCTSWDRWYSKGFNSSGYTKGASDKLDGYSGNYYIGRDPNINPYTGFDKSVSSSKSGNTYIAPSSITDQLTNSDKRECSGQGIYFLTDGVPEPGGTAPGSDGKSGTAYSLMSTALGSKGGGFTCANSLLGKRSNYTNSRNAWSCIGNFAQSLLDSTKNTLGLQIKTVVVGFGSSFGSGTTNDDVEDAKTWGNLGGGGWVAGSSPQDIVNSINNFIKDITKDIPSMSTGSSTIPMDALNPEVVQPYSYFPQFEPKVKPEDVQQLWLGNLKKYYVLNNSVYAKNKVDLVIKASKVQDVTDLWNDGGITYTETTPIYQKGGALSQLVLGTTTDTHNAKITGRTLLTNYDYDGTKTGANQVTNNLNLVKVKYTYTTDTKTKTDTIYARSLMALLGYNITNDENTNGLDLTNRVATIRQMGSVYHSNPVLLTQEGKVVAKKNDAGQVYIDSESREDYALFGTTQGLVSVVDAKTGVEKFSFVPKEMIEKQSETFKLNGGSLAGGKNALYYGMDGEWTAQTVYVSKDDGTLTVKGTVRNVIGSATDKENLKGKQWVYGGMRMGGRSYYALDLTDMDNPKIKFQIDPSAGMIYSQDSPTGKSFPAIQKMGQSWSKPKIDYVNWKGQRKLVMFVGGGYDAGGDDGDGLKSNGVRTGYAGYEYYNYKQENSTSTNKKIGAGVYMFDADNGDLLWYTDSTNDANVKNTDLNYSVVSQIKTVDRNNDGVVDHLYFGDLSGQAFRVDFKNDGASTFTAQVNKILDIHKTDGTSPRFYLPPVFTAHRSAGQAEGGNIVVATFISGNKSSPLLGTPDSPSATGWQNTVGLQYDAVYAIYDYDIFPNGANYPVGTQASPLIATRTLAVASDVASTSKLKLITATTSASNNTGAIVNKTSGWGGWYYKLTTKFNGNTENESVIKGLSPLIAMGGALYVTMFDSADNGTSSSCGAGVKGNSYTKRMCLPTGVCSLDADYTYNLGSGIVAPQVGGGGDGDPNCTGDTCRTLIIPDPSSTKCVGTACGTTNFFATGGTMRFVPNRWYERYAKVK
ncbi:hypothetical protein [Acinetobacter ursingii]|uniref:hypothetical protein n=1 Tax=Acinetobacter ursingii TaxID=108980 RepID=UPI0002CE1034|nr:hypothetical protein [Acinetobacter ursingii]ENV77578.1 hypothetical protein F944_00036 [Acinetobacter ursingii DSM 16037 = CIP 107286]QQT65955.1 hypothetical protein I6I52_15105 [Acinetobacter ursingii]